jgi:hypothetical protein
MRFQLLPQQTPRHFDVVYRNQDHALISVPTQASFGYSLSFNEVQLELSETGLANHLWGYCPRESWHVTDQEPPEATLGELRMVSDSPLVSGVAVRASPTRLPVYYNEEKHWICFGNPLVNDDFHIKLTSGLIVVANSSRISALWVRVDRFEK